MLKEPLLYGIAGCTACKPISASANGEENMPTISAAAWASG
jgi:hypothetical protein